MLISPCTVSGLPVKVLTPAKVCAPIVTTPREVGPASGIFIVTDAPKTTGEPITLMSLAGFALTKRPMELGKKLYDDSQVGYQRTPSQCRNWPGWAPPLVSWFGLIITEGVSGKSSLTWVRLAVGKSGTRQYSS